MYADSVSSPSMSISFNRGTEGPRHDPYSYEEVIVERKGREDITLHAGLGVWMTIGGARISASFSMVEREVMDRFVELVGYKPDQLRRFAQRAYAARVKQQHASCKHHGNATRSVTGYPGETFEVCLDCGQIVDSHFNRSAIE